MQRELEVFHAVMRTGSANAAADFLGISQPAVSQFIQKLEKRADISLFVRERGRLVATPEAHALMESVEKNLAGLEAVAHRIATLKQFGLGKLTVASYPAFGMGFLPRVLARKASRVDQQSVSLQLLSSQEVKQKALLGDCDFGLMADEAKVDGLQHELFAQIPAVVVLPMGHALASRKVVSVKSLQGYGFISLNPEDAARKRLEVALKERGVTLQSKIETPYAMTVCELVARNVGISIVSPVAALDYADRGLVLRRFELPLMFKCLMVMPLNMPLSGLAQKFATEMRLQLAQDYRDIEKLLL
jgi:DNA-binding transcriptional LysR family regulator